MMRRMLSAACVIVLGVTGAGCGLGASGDGAGSSEPNVNSEDEAKVAYANGDYERAAVLTRALADDGNALVQFNVGIKCEQGRGVGQDDHEAMALFRKAADLGNQSAQTKLEVMCQKEKGVVKDAGALYRKAAEQGYALFAISIQQLFLYQ